MFDLFHVDLWVPKGHTTLIWNAQSFLPKIEEVERLVIKADPDFIGITETWLKPLIDDELLHIDGYNLFRHDHTDASGKANGGGLLWYYRSNCNSVFLVLSHCL